MKTIKYLKGDATSPQAKGRKIIAHICNDLGGWGKGFVLAISRRWPEPEKQYRAWHRDRSKNDFQLGAIQLVDISTSLSVANMVAQRGVKTGSKGPPIRYETVEDCLKKLAPLALTNQSSIHMPRIGCGLAGGKWPQIESIIQTQLINQGVEVFVYDFDS